MEPAAAGRPQEGRQERGGRPLVNPNEADGCRRGETRRARLGGCRCHGDRGGAEMRPQASAKVRWSCAKGHWLTAERATISRSQDRGSSCCWPRKISLIRRLARLRSMAFPTAWVEATKQARRAAATSGRASHQSVKALQSTRIPFWRTSRMSLWRRRCCPGRRRMETANPGIKRRSGACGPCACGRREPCGRPVWTFVRESRSFGLVSCGAGGRWVAWCRVVKSRLKCLTEGGVSRAGLEG